MNNDTLLMVDGTSKQVAPKNGTDYSLDELQGFVDGLIEIVSSPNGVQDTWINCKGELVTSWEEIEEAYKNDKDGGGA